MFKINETLVAELREGPADRLDGEAEEVRDVTLEQGYIRKVGHIGLAGMVIGLDAAQHVPSGQTNTFAKATSATEEGDCLSHAL